MHAANTPDITYRGVYCEYGSRFIEGGSLSTAMFELHDTFVGQSKEWMNIVDSDLKVLDVSSVFGPNKGFMSTRLCDQFTSTFVGEH